MVRVGKHASSEGDAGSTPGGRLERCVRCRWWESEADVGEFYLQKAEGMRVSGVQREDRRWGCQARKGTVSSGSLNFTCSSELPRGLKLASLEKGRQQGSNHLVLCREVNISRALSSIPSGSRGHEGAQCAWSRAIMGKGGNSETFIFNYVCVSVCGYVYLCVDMCMWVQAPGSRRYQSPWSWS